MPELSFHKEGLTVRKNLFAALLAVVCLLVSGNMSFAQDCKNGKCPTASGKSFVVPAGFKSVAGPASSSGSCAVAGSCKTAGCTGGSSCESCGVSSKTGLFGGTHKGLFQRIRERRHGG